MNSYEQFGTFFITNKLFANNMDLESSDSNEQMVIPKILPCKKDSNGINVIPVWRKEEDFSYAPTRVRERNPDRECRERAPKRRRERTISCSGSDSD